MAPTTLATLDAELEALLAADTPALEADVSQQAVCDWEARIAGLEARVAHLDPEAIQARTHAMILDACLEAAKKVQTLVSSTHASRHNTRPHTR